MPNVVQRRVALLSDDGKFADSMTPQAVLDAVEHVDLTAAQALAAGAVASTAAERAEMAVGRAEMAVSGRCWVDPADSGVIVLMFVDAMEASVITETVGEFL